MLGPIEHLIYWFEGDKGSLSQEDVTENILNFIMKALETRPEKRAKR